MAWRIALKLDLGQLFFRQLFDGFPGSLGLLGLLGPLGPLGLLGRRVGSEGQRETYEDGIDQEHETAGYTATGHEYYLTPTSMLQHYKS